MSPGPASARDYVELRCRSAFSFLEAASNPEELVDCAAALDYPALALGDRDGLYGSPRFHQAATRAGLHAIVGAELCVARRAPDPGLPRDAQPRDALRLLVESPRGYRNLSRLLTLSQRRGGKGEALASWDELEEHAADLVALVRGDAQLCPALLARARGVFGDRLWVDVSRHQSRDSEQACRRSAALAEQAGVPVVATNDVRHARPEGRCLFDALTCLRERTSLDRAGRRLARNALRHLRSREEMAACFADRPEWIRASRTIAERCAFTLANLGYRFPEFPIPPGESQDSFLRILTEHGARERYGHPLPEAARRQLERELRVIEKLELSGYFLIVHDIARFAREQRILAQGRGSAANSAVCYALGITAVDPVAMGLLFERFLSEERGEWPDIDIDLPSGDQREKAIQYVFDKYGEHGAAMTAVVITYQTRLAVREMGKVLGMGDDVISRLAGLLSSMEHRDDHESVEATLRQAGVDPSAPRIQQLLALCGEVRGLPRHLGQHTGGIVIAAGRLDEVVPIEPARMANRRVVQWDKEDCADLGIIKIDLLGLGMLRAIEDTLERIRVHEGRSVDLAHLPADDPATYAMIRRADTIGTFQIESRAQMATLPRMQPRHFYDLVVEVALIRPGPITGKMVHPYLNRRAGREPVRYPHPSLEPILRRTLGVPIFQEQLLRIAMTAAGFSGGEAEELRRAMGFKRSVERMNAIERRLVDGMTARGITGEAQQEILRGITSFALYGFPESHAASFALIAYASAFLKCQHPAAFLVGLLNAQPMGFYAPSTLVKDAQRHGVEVRPIDVAHSEWDCTLETSTPASAAERRAQRGKPSGAQRGEAERRSHGTAERRSHGTAERRSHGTAERSSVRLPASAAERHAQRGKPSGAQRGEAERRSHGTAERRSHGTAERRSHGTGERSSVRLGLRYVTGLSERSGRAIVAARPFAHVADLAARAAPKRDELSALAELGALASIDARASSRRAALWQVAALERDPRSLFAGRPLPDGHSPLPEMSALEETLADYLRSGLTTGAHLMTHLRPALERRGVLPAAALRDAPDGRYVRTAGHAIVRQRPGTARGFCFLTLEDETGTSNAVLTPRCFRRFRVPLHSAAVVEIAGPVQNVDDVVHVRVRELRPLVPRGDLPRSHDYR